jgi:argininosuccinate lyase
MSEKLWSKGRSSEDWVIRFTVGDDYRWDQLLLPFDVRATVAHVNGLSRIGVVTEDERDSITRSLEQLLGEYEDGSIVVEPDDEDCHTVIEQYLTEQLGHVGKKVHTGRSRNDQVLAALRLYLRASLTAIAGSSADLCRRLLALAEKKDGWVMPGYTHTRQAMPSSVGAWALGFAELVLHDLEGVLEARNRTNLSPLGSAAGYGVPFLEMPRHEVAHELGFADVQTHVTSVQLSRGKLELAVVHALAQLSLTMNRLASDLILFSSAEFGFVELAVEHTTGSSIMPQKQNPDVLELVRATYHRVLAEMQLLASLSANLTSGYHRDLQLTKEAVMRATMVTGDALQAMKQTLNGLRFDRGRMEAVVRPDTMATHEAIRKATEGVAFRDAYRSAGTSDDEMPSASDALKAYKSVGYPGRGDLEALTARLVAAEARF